MSDEQKIEGVPDGWRIARLVKHDSHGISFEAILEYAPKSKRRILIAEAEVPKDFKIEGSGAIVAYRGWGTGISLDVYRFSAEVFRIEERDA